MNINFNKYFNLQSLTKEQQQVVIGAITDLILARLADMIGDHLTEDEISELEKMGNNTTSDEIINWLNEHVPNISQGIEELLEEESQSIAQKIYALTNYALEAKSNG